MVHLHKRNEHDILYIISFLLEVKRGSLGQDKSGYREFFNDTEQPQGRNEPHFLKWELELKNEIDLRRMGLLGKDLLDSAIEYTSFLERG